MAFRTQEHTDLTKFGNRLWILMEKRGIDTAKKLAAKLYDCGYNLADQRENFDYESKVRSNAIDSMTRIINEHIKASTTEKLQGKYVDAYCNFFDCSTDYLFGKIDCTTHDKAFIKNETGLSEIAIDKLQEAQKYNDALCIDPALPFINTLLEQLDPINYNDILHEIAAYLRSDGLNQDMWYNIESRALFHKECNRGKDFNFPIPAHSEVFDNLLLMDIQERLRQLKKQLKGAQY